MATKAVSPGAALLRTSRLFSLPNQLPPAPGDVSGAGKRNSDSATQPFPTLQAITSPKASRNRGDWGFKRPLPAKVTAKSTTPLVRVKHIDSIEQVTDFATATDHAMTLRKWQEMNVPITLQTDFEQRHRLAGKSVFEEAADVIAIDPSKKHTADDKRWKFEGPWLAGITEGAFQKYLKKQVRTRRPEFREFLRTQLAADLNRTALADAMDAGMGTNAPKTLTAADITDSQLTEHLRELRQDRPLLYRLVGKFLDLAPLEPSSKVVQNLNRSSSLASALGLGSAAEGGYLSALNRQAGGPNSAANPWAQDGPPITHPSAGLSYLRSAAYIENHPLYGPQKAHQPVEARIVAPRNPSGSQSAKLGVGGFITDNPFGETAYNAQNMRGFQNTRTMPGLSILDPKIEGGAKVPVRVSAAKVNSQGRAIVTVAEADPEAVLIQRELEGKEPIYGQPGRLMSTRADSNPRYLSRYPSQQRQSTVVSSPQNYGLF